MQETWKPVLGFEDRYQVSDLGRVAFVKNGVRSKPRSTPPVGRGYPMVSFAKDGKVHNVRVHRLVALAFLAKPNGKCQVNHIDGDKANNAVSNLEWVSHRENSLHAVRLGLISHARGEKHVFSKLTDADVIEIRKLLASKVAPKVIAARFGVARTTIYGIKSGIAWRHI
jgi:hypothetical protein